MAKLNELLHERELSGQPVRHAVIGAGVTGRGIVDVTNHMEGMSPSFVADLDVEKARSSLLRSGITEREIVETDDPVKAEREIQSGRYVVSADSRIVADIPSIDVVTECTGLPDTGADIAIRTITAKKHTILMNVETDICVSPILKRMADAAGVVYSLASGDEPACTMELIDFANSLGVEVIAAGKGKNTPWHPDSTPDDVHTFYPKMKEMDGANAQMFCSFVDGSKTAIEMAAIANAAGLRPQVRGMLGPKATTPEELAKILCKKEDGGLLDGGNIIDYCIGLAPAVFCVVKGNYPTPIESFATVFGDSVYYTFLRAYHFPALESALASAKAVLLNEAVIAPRGGLYCEVITAAKKDLQPGEVLDGIGGYCTRGSMDDSRVAKKDRLLPLSLALGCVVKRFVKKNEYLTYDDVDMPETTIGHLRRIQDMLFA